MIECQFDTLGDGGADVIGIIFQLGSLARFDRLVVYAVINCGPVGCGNLEFAEQSFGQRQFVDVFAGSVFLDKAKFVGVFCRPSRGFAEYINFKNIGVRAFSLQLKGLGIHVYDQFEVACSRHHHVSALAFRPSHGGVQWQSVVTIVIGHAESSGIEGGPVAFGGR